MAKLITAVATDLRTVRVTFNSALPDLGSGATGALNPGNWTFEPQVVSPVPVVSVSTIEVDEISTTVFDVIVDDDFSPEQLYQIVAKPAAGGGIAGVDSSPDNKALFQAIPIISPPERDFSTLRMVPNMNLREDDNDDLTRFLNILNDVLGLSIQRVDLWTSVFDYEKATENFLDLMLQDLAYPFAIQMGEIDKRRLLSVLATIYKQKGTVDGVKNAIRFFVGYESDVIWPDWAQFGGWILDESELDYDTVLGEFFYSSTLHGTDMVVFTGAGAFDFYLKVGVPTLASLTAEENLKVRAVVEFMKPAHTHLIGVTTAFPPPLNVVATPGVGTITVSWSLVPLAIQYVIFSSSTPVVGPLSPVGNIDPDDNTPFVLAVPSGESRYFRVCARLGTTNGVASARVNATAL